MLIAIKEEFIAARIIIDSFLECAWISLKGAAFRVIIGVFYRPPDMSGAFSYEYHRFLSEVYTLFPNSVIIIFEYFNFPNIELVDALRIGHG